MTTSKTFIPAAIVALALVGGAIGFATQPGNPGGQPSHGEGIWLAQQLLAQADDPFGSNPTRITPPAERDPIFDYPDDERSASDQQSDLFDAEDGSRNADDSDSSGDVFSDDAADSAKWRDGPADLKQISAAEQNIRESLTEPTQIDFLDAPLAEVVDYLKEFHGVEIVIDPVGLSEAGIETNIPISLTLRGIPLGKALKLILEPLQLDYFVRHDVLQITSKEKVDRTAETHIYSIRGITLQSTKLLQAIRRTIRPSTWLAEDQQPTSAAQIGTIAAIPDGIIVRQSQHAHEEIGDLLRQLARLNEK